MQIQLEATILSQLNESEVIPILETSSPFWAAAKIRQLVQELPFKYDKAGIRFFDRLQQIYLEALAKLDPLRAAQSEPSLVIGVLDFTIEELSEKDPNLSRVLDKICGGEPLPEMQKITPLLSSAFRVELLSRNLLPLGSDWKIQEGLIDFKYTPLPVQPLSKRLQKVKRALESRSCKMAELLKDLLEEKDSVIAGAALLHYSSRIRTYFTKRPDRVYKISYFGDNYTFDPELVTYTFRNGNLYFPLENFEVHNIRRHFGWYSWMELKTCNSYTNGSLTLHLDNFDTILYEETSTQFRRRQDRAICNKGDHSLPYSDVRPWYHPETGALVEAERRDDKYSLIPQMGGLSLKGYPGFLITKEQDPAFSETAHEIYRNQEGERLGLVRVKQDLFTLYKKGSDGEWISATPS